jgi:serine/threonine protein phosphatase PrpC
VVTAQVHDLFLLCSDGIWKTFDEDAISRTLEERRLAAASELVEAARRSTRNDDDVTAVVVEILSGSDRRR